jgi:uncharacterized membrane protein (DUF373 family)
MALGGRGDDRDGAPKPRDLRQWIIRGYSIVEDGVYLGLGLLLAAIVLLLLGRMLLEFGRNLPGDPIELLDRILLALLIVELLYTVQVSFKTQGLQAEPFLLVGIISGIRQVLVLTAQMTHEKQAVPALFVIELAVLGFLILALVVALVLIRKTRMQRPRELE